MDDKVLKIIDKYISKTRKECYRINYLNIKPGILDDKIGGQPYLPIGEEYPLDSNGNPMTLLIQINLNKISLTNYPKGILEVFVTTNNEEVYANSNLSENSYAIRFYEEGLEYQRDIPIIEVKDFLYEHPLKIFINKSFMSRPYNMDDNKSLNLLLDLFEEEYDVKLDYPMQIEDKLNIDYYELMNIINEKNNFYSNIGGYPLFYNDVDIDYLENDECVLFIDSDLNKGLCFGADAGSFYMLITKEDLVNKNFKNAICKIQF